MKQLKVRNLGVVGFSILAMAASGIGLTSCNKTNTFMIWGPEEHRDMYLALGKEFKEQNPSFDGDFAYAANGDAGAYSNMSIDPQAGGTIYTFANDMLNNLNRLGSLAPLKGDNLTWAENKNTSASVDAGKIGDNYYAYPVQADNGYYMYFRKDVFKDTAVWDSTTGTLKDGYTFRDLYSAIDEKAKTDTSLTNAKVTWALGDSWYVSGVFFAVGGDYKVTYDEKGNQTEAKCWFAYDSTVDADGSECKIGLDATYALMNTITDEPTGGSTAKGTTINKHYMFSDGDKSPLNDNISKYASKEADKNNGTPLVAAVCGTWKAKEIQKFWGDDYACTYLPAIETPDGVFQMKNFCGFKLMGVNPLSTYCSKSEENLAWAHKVAQFMSDKESQLQRYAITGAGPSNKEALNDDTVKSDAALKALNAQYDHVCNYPGTSTPVGNGLGYRVQDSVPANYWTPIQVYGTSIYNEISANSYDKFRTDGTIKRAVKQLQADVEAAAQ
jgi:arabinogalactan oligomer/maltooligosaccharide transport system substrate-binding protein